MFAAITAATITWRLDFANVSPGSHHDHHSPWFGQRNPSGCRLHTVGKCDSLSQTATSSPTIMFTTNYHPSSHINEAAQMVRGALGAQGNTGGMCYDSHPSKMVCKFDFLVILCWIIEILVKFHAFFMCSDAFRSSRDTKEHMRDVLWQPSLQNVCKFDFWSFYLNYHNFSQISCIFHMFERI